MGRWTIDKSFNWEMGHRVWAQELNNPEFSLSTQCACKHLHGHSYKLKVFLTGKKLDQSQMVTDFKNLNFVKQFLDNSLDHKFMVDIYDPNFHLITGIGLEYVQKFENFKNLFECVDIIEMGEEMGVEIDDNFINHLEGFVLVDFCPTSENICKHLKEYIEVRMKAIAKVDAVELWETEKSHCRYE